MYKFLVDNGQRLAFGVGLLITVAFLINVLVGMEEFSALPEEDQASTNIFNLGLTGAIVLSVVAAVAMVLFGLYHIASNFRSSAKGLIGVAALVLIFVIAYSMAAPEADHVAIVEASKKIEGGISSGQMKFIGGSIMTAMILTGFAAAAFVLSEIRNFFK